MLRLFLPLALTLAACSPADPPAQAHAQAQAQARLTVWPQPGNMPAFGDEAQLGPSEIADLTEYVLALAGAPRDPAAIVRAVPLYQAHCASCHGLGGEGAEMLGAPDLTRGQFRYATDAQDIQMQIWHGSDGRGPKRQAARTPSRPKG